MGKYDAYDVFTPTSPARLTFVERETVNTRLVDALRTPGMQIVVYGHSGSGKTTLLVNKLHQLYPSHITSRCMKGVTFEQLVLDAFDQLSVFYSSEVTNGKTENIAAAVKPDYFIIKSQISASIQSENTQKFRRVLPPQLTPQTLGRFMGEAKTCWVLEDFHKIANEERSKLSQVMKVFMDMADNFRSLKIVAIGAVDTARQVIEYDAEMRNRVSEIQVPLMEKNELCQIISIGSKLLNLKFDSTLSSGVTDFSNGMASVCHQLCLNVCSSEQIFETKPEELLIDTQHLNTALQMYLDQSSDTIKKAFDSAFNQKRTKKFNNAKIILKAVSELPQDGATRHEIYSKILKNNPDYPHGNMTMFAQRLCRESEGSLLRHEPVSGKFSFRDPIYRAFALAYFSKGKADMKPKLTAMDFEQLFKDLKLEVNLDGVKRITISLSGGKST